MKGKEKSEKPSPVLEFMSEWTNYNALVDIEYMQSIDEGKDIAEYKALFDAVDTTAAGDTFTGYFISGLVKKRPVTDILKLSFAASALAVSKAGAAP